MKFDCTGCGCCCTKVGDNMALLKQAGFPYDVKPGTKTCEKFDDKTRQCAVYRNRPDVCNVDKMFYAVHSSSGRKKKEVFMQEAIICNTWMNEEGIDVRKRIDLTQYK